MLDRRPDRAGRAERMADHIGAGDPEMVHQRRNVIAQRLELHRSVGVRRATVALHLHRDHLPRRRQHLQPSPHLTDGGQPPMDQHHGLARAVDLVIEPDAVHLGEAASRG